MNSLIVGSVIAGALLFGAVDTSVAHAKKPGAAWEKKQHDKPVAAVPELDPSGAASVASLALAGALVLSHRRKSTQAA